MKFDAILLTEPANAANLYPFSIMHPLWELRCGALRIFEKVQRQYPTANLLFRGRTLQLRSFLARYPHFNQEIIPSNYLVLNANLLPNLNFWNLLEEKLHFVLSQNSTDKPIILNHKNKPIGAYISSESLANGVSRNTTDSLSNFEVKFYANALEVEIEVQQIDFLWDAIHANEAALLDDARFFSSDGDIPTQSAGIFTIKPEQILLCSNVNIAPFTVLDASGGPIIIGNNVKIMPHSTITGPCYIGDNSTLKIGAKIYEKTSIGEFCKIGGEVESSIIQGFSNKQHGGFLGHSFISEWVNLGADTNTSDLKNNYSNVKVRMNDTDYQTGHTFLGLLCGDHTKVGINTMFNTGTVVGISANIFGGGYPDKFIPSFTWGGLSSAQKFSIDKAITLAKIVMERRNKILSVEEELIFRKEYDRS